MAVASHELKAPALQGLEQAHRAAAREKSIFRRNFAKGPNPLAVKKKKRKKPQQEADAAPEEGGEAQAKRKRARRRRGDPPANSTTAATEA